MTEMNFLTRDDYKNLLVFSESLNPYDMDFRKEAMNNLLKYFSFEGAAFPLVDDKGYYKHLVYVNFTPVSIESYERDCYKKDFFAPANLKETYEKSVFTIEDFTSYVEYEASSLYSQCLHFNGFYYEALVLLRDEENKPLGAVAVYHGRQSKGFTIREQKLLKEIGIIMEKAIRIHLKCLSMQNNLFFLNRIFTRHPIGMILCDENFDIQEINREAYQILEALGMAAGKEDAKLLLTEYILPACQEGGSNRLFLRVATGLEVFLENMIVKEQITGRFITRYAVFLKPSVDSNTVSWTAYLTEKGLTRREREVADYLCQGCEIKEIAEKLSISLNTVKRHKESIYIKLSVNRASQLLVLHQKIQNSQ
ncbi:response regulator transcription factor [Anaerocolumna xylanovorans]|uniref:Regulatory protein, luxR family n=1 Tax=Anaerocolumna xylanovorans DSM 12503 TaxID=1121345 RepID=A0A1M7YHB0_9FIRM|nr:helix-turn-helix transcriptional regulator [Anaerocolumna xylanovorans]SHO52010.1 regulatory protein, luxR family [Anaerocolumna xylanovorans DSM 12503]